MSNLCFHLQKVGVYTNYKIQNRNKQIQWTKGSVEQMNMSIYQMTPYNHNHFRPQANATVQKAVDKETPKSFQDILNAQLSSTRVPVKARV